MQNHWNTFSKQDFQFNRVHLSETDWSDKQKRLKKETEYKFLYKDKLYNSITKYERSSYSRICTEKKGKKLSTAQANSSISVGNTEKFLGIHLKAKPVQYKDMVFPSITDAAKHFNVKSPTIRYRCESENLKNSDWAFLSKETYMNLVQNSGNNEKDIEQKDFKTKGVIKVIVDQKEFESISAASRFFEIDSASVVKRCASSNFPNWISPEISKENKKQKGSCY